MKEIFLKEIFSKKIFSKKSFPKKIFQKEIFSKEMFSDIFFLIINIPDLKQSQRLRVLTLTKDRFSDFMSKLYSRPLKSTKKRERRKVETVEIFLCKLVYTAQTAEMDRTFFLQLWQLPLQIQCFKSGNCLCFLATASHVWQLPLDF